VSVRNNQGGEIFPRRWEKAERYIYATHVAIVRHFCIPLFPKQTAEPTEEGKITTFLRPDSAGTLLAD
jgi:hypothetical protein